MYITWKPKGIRWGEGKRWAGGPGGKGIGGFNEYE